MYPYHVGFCRGVHMISHSIKYSRPFVILLVVSVLPGCMSTHELRYTERQPPFPPLDYAAIPGKIEPPLSRYLESVRNDVPIPVVLTLDRQVTDADKVRLFSRIKANDRGDRKEEQRSLLIEELKKVARAEQVRLVAFLRALEKAQQVQNVRPLWISNVVGVVADKAIIDRLTAFREVKSIHLDIPRPVKGEVAWGVTQINGDDVWGLVPTGYNGTGVTVAILDTGVDYTHGDLVSRMWINTPEDIDSDGRFTSADNNGIDDDGNGYVDDVVGWNFSGAGNNDPADVAAHGTHVAGTVAGDGSGGSNIGVAPGARIMALRESSTAALSTEQECWDGMQYALDNGADIVNFSSGWLDIWAPAYETWRNNVNNLMDGGVLFVTIAHNDSSATGIPNNVRTPGRVPLAVTVGATDNTDTIAGFSNNGPITWQTVSPFFDYPWPPGLTKPDVSAPGVAVKSAQNGGGYVNGPIWSGTSMAAPHAAGTAALLLDKTSGLNPYELKFLLEETAVDLGVAGPDNAYGWGRVNALDAVNFAISATPFDLSITGTTSVWTSVDIWVDNDDNGTPDTPIALANNHLYARVTNLGGQVVTNVEIKFYFADVSTIGIGGFDPNGDGDPSDGSFTYIGSYRVPTMGPSGSAHDTVVGLVNWNIPTPPGDHWCAGVGIVAPSPPNPAETNTLNNRAFRNFFDIITSAAGFAFKIVPPPTAPNKPFGLEILTKNLPRQARVELVFDKSLEKRLIVQVDGLTRVQDPLLMLKPMGREYFKALEGSISDVRYELKGERAVLSKIVNSRGDPFPARLVVHLPEKFHPQKDMLIVLNTFDQQGTPVGGLTLNVIKGTPYQEGGPYLPKPAP